MFKKTSSKVNEIEIVDEKVTFTNLTTDISEQKHGWTSQNSRQQSCTIRSQQLAAPTSTSTCFGESSSSLTNVNSYPVGAKIIESIAMQSHPNDHENSSSKHHLSSDNLENDFHKRKRSEPIDDTFRPLDISEPRFMKMFFELSKLQVQYVTYCSMLAQLFYNYCNLYACYEQVVEDSSYSWWPKTFSGRTTMNLNY